MLQTDEVKTIEDFLKEYGLPLCIKKLSWSGDFYFKIERIEDCIAKGTAYKNGEIYTRTFGVYQYSLTERVQLFGSNTPLYNEEGFDKEGYNREGYDKDGFDRLGYDREGYNKEGYNREGYDHQGYDKDGYDRSGYDRDGYNRKGYDKYGYDREGYDKKGYNRRGYDREGYNKEGYDREGYDRQGYDKNGFNRDGYDKDGYDRTGYDKEGFNRLGYDREGYNRNGFNINGIPKTKPTFSYLPGTTKIYHKQYGEGLFVGVSESGGNKIIHILFDNGNECRFDFPRAMGVNLFLEPVAREKPDNTPKPEKKGKKKSSEKQNNDTCSVEKNTVMYPCPHEQDKLNEIERRIDELVSYYDTAAADLRSDVFSSFIVDKEDMFIRREKMADAERNFQWSDYYRQAKPAPYFRRVKLNIEKDNSASNKELFIGNMAVGKGQDEIVVDWRSRIGRQIDGRKTSFTIDDSYYQLVFQREVEIAEEIVLKYKTLLGEEEDDKGSLLSESSLNGELADEWLLNILEQNRNKHAISDIIKTIQVEQNKIMDRPLHENFVVQGCAGSGKTMVLLHRLSVLLYQNPDIDPSKIWIITPNEYFNSQIKELDRNLDLDQVTKYSIEGLYKHFIENILNNIAPKETSYKDTMLPDQLFPDSLLEVLYSRELLDKIQDRYLVYNYEFMGHLEAENFRDIMGIPDSVTFKKASGEYECSYEMWKSIKGFAEGKLIRQNEYIQSRNDALKRLKEQLRKNKDAKAKIEKIVGTQTDECIEKIKHICMDFGFYRDKPFKTGGDGAYLTIDKEKIKEIVGKDVDIDELYKQFKKIDDKLPKGLLEDIQTCNKKIYKFKSRGLLEKQASEVENIISWNNVRAILDSVLREEFEKFGLKYKRANYRYYLFLTSYLLSLLYGEIPNKPVMICIDEAQDLGIEEYRLISKITGNNKTVNLYGDVNQKIYSYKGISNWNMLGIFNIDNVYTLERNYRNSRQITEFCNREFNTETAAIGINAEPVLSVSDIGEAYNLAETYKDNNQDSRVVIICKSVNNVVAKIRKAYHTAKSSPFKIDYSTVSVITVEQAKGLEFECVVAATEDMSECERYVSYTRALEKLITV